MAEPDVSVVVPVHEGERFLDAALDSVSRQTVPVLETIVVDDDSPDASADVAAAHAGVRVLRRSRSGVGAARNAGIAVARGGFIALLDQDDVWLPDKIARQLAAFARTPELGFVLTHIQTVLEPEVPRPDWCPAAWLDEPRRGFVPSTWLVRRETFDRVGAFDEGFAIACDSDWLARAKDAGVASEMLPEVLVQWRLHGANGSYDQATMSRELMSVMRRTVKRQKAGGRGD